MDHQILHLSDQAQILFQVQILEEEAAVRGDKMPPTSVHGERLPFGWVEAIPGASFGVGISETLAVIGESSSGKSLMILGAFGLLPSGTRVLSGTTTYRGASFEPAGRREEPTQPIRRKDRKRLARSGTVFDDADPEWARLAATEAVSRAISRWITIRFSPPGA